MNVIKRSITVFFSNCYEFSVYVSSLEWSYLWQESFTMYYVLNSSRKKMKFEMDDFAPIIS